MIIYLFRNTAMPRENPWDRFILPIAILKSISPLAPFASIFHEGWDFQFIGAVVVATAAAEKP
jgi:hypothetical protein